MLWDSSSRVQLSKIPALTFDKHSQAVGRRTKVPQLVCKGKPCSLYQPEVVHCRRLSGGSGTDIDWKVSFRAYFRPSTSNLPHFSVKQIFLTLCDLEKLKSVVKDGRVLVIPLW